MRATNFRGLALGCLLAAPTVWAHDCVVTGGHANCNDGTSYTYQGGVGVGSDGTTIIRTPDGVYIGHQHPQGVRPPPPRDPRLGDEAHPGCKKVDGREVCG